MKGRKRHALVDTLGLPEVLQVTRAGVQDRDGGRAAEAYGLTMEVVKRPKEQRGFVVLPRRWVVERLFRWFSHSRRLSKDYEVWPETQVSMLHLALIHLLVRRQAA